MECETVGRAIRSSGCTGCSCAWWFWKALSPYVCVWRCPRRVQVKSRDDGPNEIEECNWAHHQMQLREWKATMHCHSFRQATVSNLFGSYISSDANSIAACQLYIDSNVESGKRGCTNFIVDLDFSFLPFAVLLLVVGKCKQRLRQTSCQQG